MVFSSVLVGFAMQLLYGLWWRGGIAQTAHTCTHSYVRRKRKRGTGYSDLHRVHRVFDKDFMFHLYWPAVVMSRY